MSANSTAQSVTRPANAEARLKSLGIELPAPPPLRIRNRQVIAIAAMCQVWMT